MAEKENIKEKAIIYRKQSKRPLTQYQCLVNTAAQKLCLRSPTMLTKRGDLLIAAQAAVKTNGYQFKKGFSRSKNAASTSSSPPKKRRKLNQELRTKRILELREDIKDYNNRILFKEKRCEAALAVKNYKLCDNLTEEMCKLKANLRTHEAELKMIQSKQRRSELYVGKKTQQKIVKETSDSESDCLSTTRSDSLNLTPSDDNLSRSGSSQPPNSSTLHSPFLSPTTEGIVPNTSTPQMSVVQSTSQFPVVSLSSSFEASANEPSASDSQYFQIGLPAVDLSNVQLLGGQ